MTGAERPPIPAESEAQLRNANLAGEADDTEFGHAPVAPRRPAAGGKDRKETRKINGIEVIR
jgi:hypothetical protein